ncbi:MAG: gliding motility-associated C-terminal domain-containing protein [Bacteroidetes bacterium]|nr:gliding motility-associated C-terminal domain-containing protein [Bacteroidota bacterium]
MGQAPKKLSTANKNNSRTAGCPENLDVEFGNFSRWESNTGRVSTDSTRIPNFIQNDSLIWNNTGGFFSDRYELIDRVSNPPVDKYGGFPVNPTIGGGRYSIKLGSDKNDPASPLRLPNALTESVRFKIVVDDLVETPSILFSFAVVFENPNHPNNLHTYGEQPRFIARMYEVGGDTLPCVNFTFVASDPALTFDTSAIYKIDSSQLQYPGAINFALVKYLPWNQVFINLKPYKGKTLYLEFTTTDCTKKGHFGYAYVDVIECNYQIKVTSACKATTTNFDGPVGPFSKYEWFNQDFSRRYGVGKSVVLNESLPRGSIINLVLTPYNGLGCKDTINAAVEYSDPPVNLQVNSGTVCQGQSLNLAASGADTYTWSPATGLNTTVGATVIANPTSTTTYTIEGVNSTTGCKSATQTIVSVIPPLNIVGSALNSATCTNNNGTINLSGLVPNRSYEVHYNKDGVAQTPLVLNANNSGLIQIINLNAGVYNDIRAVFNGCASNKVGPFAIVDPIPSPPLLSLKELKVCAGSPTGSVIFTAAVGASVSWNNSSPSIGLASLGSGNINSFTAINNGTTPITSIVKVKAVANGCSSAEEELKIIVNPKPVINVTSGQVCFGESINLTVTGTGIYSWSPSGSLNATTGGNVVATPITTTVYTVEGINNATGCSNAATSIVVVYPLPVASIATLANFICEGTNIVLTGLGGNSYEWFRDGQLLSGANSSTYLTDKPGIYTLKAISDKGCSAFAAKPFELFLIEKQKPDFRAITECGNQQIQLVNRSIYSPSSDIKWKWNFGDGNFSTLKEPIHTYQQYGNYAITLIANSNQCQNHTESISKNITIQNNIDGIRYPTINALRNSPTSISATRNATRFQWTPSLGLNNPLIRNPIFNYSSDQEYLIRFTDNLGCSAVDTLLVQVFDVEDIQIPDAFTPNGDGINDYLDIFLIGGASKIKFWVFNRWGQLMFETTDPAQRWDGNYQGKKQPLENYVWIAEITTSSGKIIRKRGQTILIR